MIRREPDGPGGGARLLLRPPRALTARQFVALFAALAAAMWLLALLGWRVGNVFAPLFALLYSALLALALRQAWRAGERGEVIAVSQARVQVSRMPGTGVAFRAHPFWTRLERGEGIVLCCSGKRVEVGEFLGPAERRELGLLLQQLLAAASGRDR
ncbi:MAG: DUF2244 domain-containing protein [Pseudoxanthomonas sp.]